jgi:hypothetical protein
VSMSESHDQSGLDTKCVRPTLLQVNAVFLLGASQDSREEIFLSCLKVGTVACVYLLSVSSLGLTPLVSVIVF